MTAEEWTAIGGIVLGIGGLLSALYQFLLNRSKLRQEKELQIEQAKAAALVKTAADEERRRNAEVERIAKGYELMLAHNNATLAEYKTEKIRLIERLEAHEKHNVDCTAQVASLTAQAASLRERVVSLENEQKADAQEIKELRERLDKVAKS
jgi:hypothetical protein